MRLSIKLRVTHNSLNIHTCTHTVESQLSNCVLPFMCSISPILFAVIVRQMAFRAVQPSRPQTLQPLHRSWTLEQGVYKGNPYSGTRNSCSLPRSAPVFPLHRG